MKLGFEVADLYPENAGIYTYGRELLRHLISLPDPPELTLLDALGRHSVEEIANRTGLPVRGYPRLPVTRLRTLHGLLPPRLVGAGEPLYINDDVDYHVFRFVRWWLSYSPQTFRPLIRRDRLRNLDVCHWSHTVFIPYSDRPAVVTVHDAIPITHPQHVVSLYPQYALAKLRIIAKHATRIIVVSEDARREVHRVGGIPIERMDVIPLAVNSDFAPVRDPGEQDRVLEQYGLTRGQYVLYVGSISPRKNILGLASAFKAFLQRMPNSPLRLVLAGRPGQLVDTVNLGLKKIDLGDRVVRLGRVPQDNLPALMSGCAVFTYVSFVEGFGLPPLEAMACGAPVLTSNTSSIPEVVGDAALLVNPNDIAEITEGLFRLVTDTELRASLAERGIRRSAEYSWHRSASMTMDTYQRAIEEHSNGPPATSSPVQHY